jgi:two-component system nitrogen regulation response regulator GlnG
VARLREGVLPDLALIDLGLPPVAHLPNEGFKLIGDLLAHVPNVRILVLTGQNEESNARRARALGAVDLVPKPCEPDFLRTALARALHSSDLDRTDEATDSAHVLIGDSPALRRLRSQIDLYAASDLSRADRGRVGQRQGARRVRAAPPVGALVRALPRAQLRRDLALAGRAHALRLRQGRVHRGGGRQVGLLRGRGRGDLFLDEIGELPLELQAKLLRVLENGEYQRVGETQTRVSRARVVAATNRDLRDEVARGRFRSDLYHRLSVFELLVPPLRELGDDRLKLLDHYRALYAAKAGAEPFRFDEAARVRWLAYPFPGNVRELKNIVIRLTTKYAGYTVAEPELDAEFAPAPESARTDPLGQARAELTSGKPFSLDATLKALEQSYLDAAIEIAQGNMSQAAKLLGISRGTLYGRLESAGRSAAKEGTR